MKPMDLEMPEFKLPKLTDLPMLLKLKLKQYKRVYSITKKPSKVEYQGIVKITGLGMLIIGVISFAIFLVVELMSAL